MGRWIWRIALALVAIVALAPTIASFAPFRNWIVNAAARDVNGSVSVDSASFGWLAGQRLDGLAVRSADGEPLITIDSLGADLPLWNLVSGSSDWGTVRVEKPHAHIIVQEGGSNFAKAFAKVKQDAGEKRERAVVDRLQQASLRVVVREAAVSWRLPSSPQNWTVEHLNLTAALEPAGRNDNDRAMLVIEPTKVLDECELTQDMCDGALKFIAPHLEGAPTGQGKVSLALDGGRLPLDDLKHGDLDGALSLHSVQIESRSRLVRLLAALVQMPPEIEVAHDAVVKFKLADGRVYHQNLDFGIRNVLVRTAGSVGFDETLDLVAEIRLRVPGSIADHRPLLDALNGQTIRLPVSGTLKDPKIDTSALGQVGVETLISTIKTLRDGKPIEAEGLAKRLQEIVQTNQSGPNTGPDVIEELIRRRRAARQGPSPEQTPDEQQQKKRPLGRLLEKVINE
jgi:hypothetical protein